MKTTSSDQDAGEGLLSAEGSTAAAAGMPLGARRLVLIGALCVPVGLVATPYMFGTQLVAVAGIVAVSVALSYRRGRAWFSPYSWVAAASGVLWMAATIAYWLSIMAAADAAVSAPGLSSALFYLGLAGMLIMAAGTIAGWISRSLSGRRAPSSPA